MYKKIEYYVAQDDDWDNHFTDGPFRILSEANSYAKRRWCSLSNYDKEGCQVFVYRQRTTYDEYDEDIGWEYLDINGLAYVIGNGKFIFDKKQYNVKDIEKYLGNKTIEIKLKDLIINWDKYEIKSCNERYIYTVYKAVDKNGKNYEVTISHDIYEGVLSSEYDKYTSEMRIEIYTRLI